MVISSILAILWLHFFAEFIFQIPNTKMYAGNSQRVVISHCICYAIPFGVFGAHFMLLICFVHYLLELFTNWLFRHTWAHKRIRWHRLVSGFDQMLHVSCIFIIYDIIGINTIVLDFLSFKLS